MQQRRLHIGRPHLLVVLFLLFYLTPSCLEASWQLESIGTASARCFASSEDGSRLFVGTNSAGLWMSPDGGASWQPLNDRFLPVSDTQNTFFPFTIEAVDPQADTVIVNAVLPFDDAGTIYTLDGGATWQPLASPLGPTGGVETYVTVSRTDHDRWYFCDRRGFARSMDAGRTWDRLVSYTESNVRFGLYEDPLSDSTLFMLSIYVYSFTEDYPFNGLSRSDDGGATWYVAIDLYDLYGIEYAAFSDVLRLSNGDLITCVNYTIPEGWFTRNLLRSRDDGQTWERIGDGLPRSFYPSKLIEDQDIPGRLYITGDGRRGIFFSEDYGDSFQRMLNGLPENNYYARDIKQNPYSGELHVSSTSYNVFRSSDHGGNWIPAPSPPVHWDGSFFIFPEFISYVDYSTRLWLLESPWEQWREILLPSLPDTIMNNAPILYKNQDQIATYVTKSSFWDLTLPHICQSVHSEDDGQSWAFEEPYDRLIQGVFYTFERGDSLLWLSYTQDRREVALTSDHGLHWQFFPLPEDYRVRGYGANEESIYIMVQTDVLRLDEENGTWEELSYPLQPDQFEVSDVFIVAGEHLFLLDQEHIQHWSDGTWEQRGFVPILEDWTPKSMTAVTGDDTLLVISSAYYNSLWISDDMGWSWDIVQIEFPYPRQVRGIWTTRYDPYRGRLWASTGMGVCWVDLEELAVPGDTLRFHPTTFSLLDVYPNPFNDAARIRYTLPRPGRVTIRMYTLEGRLVKTLLQGERPAGSGEIPIDGSGLASGEYFIRLEANGRELTRKVILLK